jgi:SPP1 gp7 family putative phage head morphogenesis protein
LREAALSAVDAEVLVAAWNGRDATKGLSGAARWVAERAKRLAEAVGRVVEDILGEGWAAGEEEALEQIDELLAEAAVSPAAERLQALLDDAGVTIKSVAASRFEELAEVLEEGVQAGRSGRDLANRVRGVLDQPQWAETVAVTETARAMSAASQATYQANRIARKSWLLAPDQRVCPKCAGNAKQGPIPTSDRFASGDRHPPAHPNCRCALMPVIDLPKAANRYQLRDYWLHGEGAPRWKTWTELYNHLKEHVGNERAKRMAAQWFHDRYGKWPGEGRRES